MRIHCTFIILFLAISSVVVSCQTRGNATHTIVASTSRQPHLPTLDDPFERPTLPLHMQTAQEQATYLLGHFWDRMDFADTTLLSHPGMELAYADYCGLLVSFAADSVASAILYPLEHSEGEMLMQALSMYRTFLYEAGSPVMSEDHYRYVLQWASRSPKVRSEYQEQARLLLDLIDKNKVGSMATDIIYTTAEGSQHRLKHSFTPRTLLVLATPNCSVCTHTLKALSSSTEVKKGIEQKRLCVVVIYLQTTAEEFALAASSLPPSFVVGHDVENRVISEQLYDIKASPTMYLIERGGKVLLKDVSLEQIKQYLEKQ